MTHSGKNLRPDPSSPFLTEAGKWRMLDGESLKPGSQLLSFLGGKCK
jgi:hypothetical protein